MKYGQCSEIECRKDPDLWYVFDPRDDPCFTIRESGDHLEIHLDCNINYNQKKSTCPNYGTPLFDWKILLMKCIFNSIKTGSSVCIIHYFLYSRQFVFSSVTSHDAPKNVVLNTTLLRSEKIKDDAREEEEKRRRNEEARRQAQLELERRIEEQIKKESELNAKKLSQATGTLKLKQRLTGHELHHQTHIMEQTAYAEIEKDQVQTFNYKC